jgi:hypothetical protein
LAGPLGANSASSGLNQTRPTGQLVAEVLNFVKVSGCVSNSSRECQYSPLEGGTALNV